MPGFGDRGGGKRGRLSAMKNSNLKSKGKLWAGKQKLWAGPGK